MKIELLYFDDCPNWRRTLEGLAEVMRDHGLDDPIEQVNVEGQEAAEELAFRGSPTILIDGIDPFLDTDAPVGLSCRIYITEDGIAGGPTREQMDSVIARITAQYPDAGGAVSPHQE